MNKYVHNDSGETKIIALGAEAGEGAEQETRGACRAESPDGISWAAAKRWSARPMVIVGALTVAALGAAGLTASAAGAFTDTRSAAPAAEQRADGNADKLDPVKGRDANGRAAKGGEDAGAKNADRGEGSPSPSHVGLCRAYRSKVGDHPGKALESPAFTSLISAAGGESGVRAYCVRVLEAKERDDKGDGEGRGKGAEKSDAKGENGARGRAKSQENADRNGPDAD